jgi:16S rRNA (cytosine1402-N4)-methyltransferase
VAIDRDPQAEERFEALAAELPCTMRFLRAGYAEALTSLQREGHQADLVMFDLGMSSLQLDARERGFSYSYDAPLDMRMDPSGEPSARALLAEVDERRLAGILRDYGEERYAKAIAAAIVRRRERQPIETTQQLVETICWPSRLPHASAQDIPPSAPSRRSGLPSTASSTRSITLCRSLGRSCPPAGASERSPFTRSRTAA